MSDTITVTDLYVFLASCVAVRPTNDAESGEVSEEVSSKVPSTLGGTLGARISLNAKHEHF